MLCSVPTFETHLQSDNEMLCCVMLRFTVLGWYFDRVLPKEYGVRLSPSFIFRRSFWQSVWRRIFDKLSSTGTDVYMCTIKHGILQPMQCRWPIVAVYTLCRSASNGDAATTAEEAALEGPSAQCAAAEEVSQAMVHSCFTHFLLCIIFGISLNKQQSKNRSMKFNEVAFPIRFSLFPVLTFRP